MRLNFKTKVTKMVKLQLLQTFLGKYNKIRSSFSCKIYEKSGFKPEISMFIVKILHNTYSTVFSNNGLPFFIKNRLPVFQNIIWS